jgi:hypothetical protein
VEGQKELKKRCEVHTSRALLTYRPLPYCYRHCNTNRPLPDPDPPLTDPNLTLPPSTLLLLKQPYETGGHYSPG